MINNLVIGISLILGILAYHYIVIPLLTRWFPKYTILRRVSAALYETQSISIALVELKQRDPVEYAKVKQAIIDAYPDVEISIE